MKRTTFWVIQYSYVSQNGHEFIACIWTFSLSPKKHAFHSVRIPDTGYRIQYANLKLVSLLIVKIVKIFYGLRLQVQKEMAYNRYAADLPREKWHSWDPMLLSGLYDGGF